jgi:hypothetical protein
MTRPAAPAASTAVSLALDRRNLPITNPSSHDAEPPRKKTLTGHRPGSDILGIIAHPAAGCKAKPLKGLSGHHTIWVTGEGSHREKS